MRNRLATIKRLVEFRESIDSLEKSVRELSWDYEGACFNLTRSNIFEVLFRYLRKELNAEEIERWANLIECREDIDFEKGHEEKLSETIFNLANPALQGNLAEDYCRELLASLGAENTA